MFYSKTKLNVFFLKMAKTKLNVLFFIISINNINKKETSLVLIYIYNSIISKQKIRYLFSKDNIIFWISRMSPNQFFSTFCEAVFQTSVSIVSFGLEIWGRFFLSKRQKAVIFFFSCRTDPAGPAQTRSLILLTQKDNLL